MTLLLALFAHPTMLFALANLKHDAKAVWGWLCHRSFWQLMFGAALLLAGWEYVGKRTEQRHANKSDAQLIKCSAGRQADRAAYVKAQADAAVANLAHNAADKAARERITNDISQSYEAQLASLRADLAKRLRVQPAAKGAPGQPGLPRVPTAAGGPDETGTVCIPSQDYVSGAETELQLDYLEQWVRGQAKVNPNAPVNSTGGK